MPAQTIRHAMRLVAVIVTLLAMAPRVAAADEWYGNQTLIGDGIGIGVTTLAIKFDDKRAYSNALLIGGISTCVFAATAVHLYHDNYARAGIAFIGRPALALVGGLIGSQIAPCKKTGPFSCLFVGDGTAVGFVVGWVTAVGLDAAFLARESEATTATPRMISFGGSF